MKIRIDYNYKDDLNAPFPNVSREVYVPSDWSFDKIIKWYENIHRNLHNCGIKVITIIQLD